MLKLRKRGQSTAEYAVLIGLVIAAAVGMRIYVERGLKARTHGAMEYLTKETNAIDGSTFNRQYEPYYMNQQYEVTQNAQDRTKLREGQKVEVTANAKTTRATGGFSEYGNVVEE
ncbi:MAG: hypothetical protein Q8O13_11200 [Candidatus Omnitrophota bacterium]|nr:hypothetical protein [Candidatus Omnitrophota bacterium]